MVFVEVILDLLPKLVACLAVYFLGLHEISVWIPITGIAVYAGWRLVITSRDIDTSLGTTAPLQTEVDDAEDDFSSSSGWLNDQSVERTEWINTVIQKIWSESKRHVFSSVEALLNSEQVEAYIAKLGGGHVTLSKLKLGPVPPRLGGVKLQGVSLDQLILDSDFQFGGEAELELSLHLVTFPQVIPLTVRKLSMAGKFRIVCKPLLNSPPYVGGIWCSFLDVPRFDFEPAGFLAATDLPGIRHLIHAKIMDAIMQSLLFPKGLAMKVPSAEAADDLKLKLPKGVFAISLLEARDLKSSDAEQAKGFFANIGFSVDGADQDHRACSAGNAAASQWKFHSLIPVDNPSTFSDVVINMFSQEAEGVDEFLGESIVSKDVIKQLVAKETSYDYWKMLENTSQGSVRMRISWSSLTVVPPKNTDDQAMVAVLVDFAKNIRFGEVERPDTRVRLRVGKLVTSTRPVFGSRSPVFEERLILFSNNPTNDDLQIELVNDQDNTVLGSEVVELTLLLNEPDLQLKNCWVKLHSSLNSHMKVRVSMALRFLQRETELPAELEVPPTLPEPRPEVKKSDKISDYKSREKSIAGTEDSLGSSSHQGSQSHDNQEMETLMVSSVSDREMEVRKVETLMERRPTLRRSYTLPLQKTTGSNRSNLRHSVKARKPPRRTTKAKVLVTLKYNKSTSVLSLVVHRADNLQEICPIPMPSPYIKTYLIESTFGRNRRDVHTKKKTKVKKNSVNPVFEETLEYFVPSFSLRCQKIEMILCSRKRLVGKRLELGRCLLSLSDLQHQASITQWILLSSHGQPESSTSLSASSSSSSHRRTSVSQSSLPT